MSKTRRGLQEIYEIAGFSRQAHSEFMVRLGKAELVSKMVLNAVLEVRNMHPSMGLKKIYYLLKPEGIGRDKFLDLGRLYGLGIKCPKSFRRTTFSAKSRIFINLVSARPITDINRVWASDTTYFRINEIFYYITFILDVYSRRILGYIAWPNLTAEANCRALQMAIISRGKIDYFKLIHHSDRGVQYASNRYLAILKKHGIGVSMCDSVYENTHIERINGTIKNEYLNNWGIGSYKELTKSLARAVHLYNHERPHWSLGTQTPAAYEEKLKTTPYNEREVIKISNYTKNYYVQQQLF